MNILLWVVQALLALLYVFGGAYKLLKYDDIATQLRPLSRGVAAVLGVIEVVGAVLLIVPLAASWMPALTPLAAAVLAVETLGLAAVYAHRSVKLVAANPFVWSAAMGLLAAVVAYGRYALV